MTDVKLPESYRAIGRAGRRAGWIITRRGNGHLAWRAPSGAVVFTSATPSDWRAVRDSKRLLRAAGLVLP